MKTISVVNLIKKSWVDSVLWFLGGMLFLFLFIPIINFFLLDPLIIVFEKFLDSQNRSALYVSFLTATITTLLAFIFGVPLGYLLARKIFRGKSLVESVVDLPILIPHSVSGLMILTAFGAHGIFKTFFDYPSDFFMGELAGIIVAQLFVSAPFMIKLSREGFEGVDPKLETVGRTLGATKIKTLLGVTFPLANRAIFSGTLLTWARAISEFGAVLFIAYTPYTVPTLILYRFQGWGLSDARPLAMLFLLLCVWVFIALRLVKRKPIQKVIQI